MILPTSLLHDIPIWTFYVSAGCCGVVWLWVGALIVLVEAAVLRLLQWDTWRRSLRDAFWMNLASTLIGIAVPILLLTTDNVPTTLAGLVAGWALSVGVEGGVLAWINRRTPEPPPRRVWLASLAANSASYALLGLIALLKFLDT